MGLSRAEEFVLFSLGRCYEEANRRFEGKPMSVALSKMAFIDLARAAGMVQKGERAMYKNLEGLEQKKLISYASKSLRLTEKGEKKFRKVQRAVGPYVDVSLLLKSGDILKFSRLQAKLK